MGSAERDAARRRAAEERQAAARRRRRTRIAVVSGAAVVVLAAVAVVAGVVLNRPAQAAAGGSAALAGRTSAPPWAAPSDVEARVKAAGLTMLTAEGEALHIHEHLSITVDGTAVTVPALLGIDEAAQQISALHTHDTSGIIHVESPVVRTFRLGQVFTEWDVALAPGRVGPYVDGADGVRLTVFVNGTATAQDPRRIVLGKLQDIDVVITTDGSTPAAPAAFTFPEGY